MGEESWMHPNLFCRLFSLSQQWRWIMISITFGNNNYLIIFLTLMFDNDFDQVWEQLWTLHHYHIWPQSPVGEINEARLFSQFFQFCKKKDSCLPFLDFLYGPVFYIGLAIINNWTAFEWFIIHRIFIMAPSGPAKAGVKMASWNVFPAEWTRWIFFLWNSDSNND